MKQFFIVAAVVVLFVGVTVGVDFAGNAYGLWSYTFWAPKQANAERKVFVNTNSYVQGKTDYLNRLRFEYVKSKDPDEKAGLKTLILSEAANVDNDKLPADLHSFINTLKEE